jgi:hypothetical protein
MADAAGIRNDIVNLGQSEQKEIATFAMRNLDRRTQESVVQDTIGFTGPTMTPEEQIRSAEAAFRVRAISVAFLAIALCIGLLALTVYAAPDRIEYVGGTITTIAGTVGGFITGRVTTGN